MYEKPHQRKSEHAPIAKESALAGAGFMAARKSRGGWCAVLFFRCVPQLEERSMPIKLQTIICSTRPGRVGPSVAHWFNDFVKEHGKFDGVIIDLADFALPILDEPQHPIMQNYQHEHTKAWSASVTAAGAFVFVAPEYNYGPTPALVNALNYL